MKLSSLLLLSLMIGCAATQRPAVVITNGPSDYSIQVSKKDSLDAFTALQEPAIAEARRTYPTAKARFLAGLPDDEHLFVTTRLHDSTGKMEQLFVVVDGFIGSAIDGRIASHVDNLVGFHQGQIVKIPETEVIDWTINHKDGREEGNYIGKFLDSLPKGDPK